MTPPSRDAVMRAWAEWRKALRSDSGDERELWRRYCSMLSAHLEQRDADG